MILNLSKEEIQDTATMEISFPFLRSSQEENTSKPQEMALQTIWMK